jgi:hypothetical protein
VYQGVGETVEAGEVGSCAMGRSGVVGEFDSDIEEGIPYITGSLFYLFSSLSGYYHEMGLFKAHDCY